MNVLIVDDNAEFCSTLSDIVAGQGWKPVTLNTPESALAFLQTNHTTIHLMLLDIEFDHRSAMDGLDVLSQSVVKYPSIPVIMISGKGTIETAVRATKLGALNFIEKSTLSHQHLVGVLQSAAARHGKNEQGDEILKVLAEQGIIGRSAAMRSVADKVRRFASTELSVLITGETGTGKKLVAKALHTLSKRAKQNFIVVDIPNIPRDLFQSELFGHLRGAFSGAMSDKKGLFHQADRGTLFLDEIGDLPLESQANLLLPLEEKYVRRVGSLDTEEVDIRFIAATDKDLLAAMQNAQFREQLYHRLRECEIILPPLRERRDDIPLIVEHTLQSHNTKKHDTKIVSPSAMEFLQSKHWMGNVRELVSLLRVVLQTTSHDVLEVHDMMLSSGGSIQPDSSQHQTSVAVTGDILSAERTRREDLDRVDKIKIEDVIRLSKGNVSRAAAQLGISRETLHVKIRKYEIDVAQYRGK